MRGKSVYSLAKLYEVSYSQFFSLMSLVDGVVHRLLVRKIVRSPWYGWQTTVFDSASDGTLIIKQQNFLTRPLQKVLRANELSDYLSSPRHGCLYESTLCLNKNYYIHNLINIPRATHVFYQTWNKFTLESALDIPHIFTLCTTA